MAVRPCKFTISPIWEAHEELHVKNGCKVERVSDNINPHLFWLVISVSSITRLTNTHILPEKLTEMHW